MAKDQGIVQSAMRRRTPLATAKAAGGLPDAPAKKRVGPVQFLREVRAEARKVTWTTRRETWITSVMVAIMVVVAMVFFWIVDAGVSFSVNQILKLASGG